LATSLRDGLLNALITEICPDIISVIVSSKIKVLHLWNISERSFRIRIKFENDLVIVEDKMAFTESGPRQSGLEELAAALNGAGQLSKTHSASA
jgi:hypothetical protein